MKRNKFFKIIFFIVLLLPTITIVNSLGWGWDPGGGGDTTPPYIAFVSPASGATVSGTVTITVIATDSGGMDYVKFYIGSTYLGLDSTASNNQYSKSFNSLNYNDDGYTLKAYAYDDAQNVAGTQRNIYIDNIPETTPPTLTITNPISNEIYGKSVTVTWSGYDASGIDRYYVKVDTGVWLPKNLETTHTFLGLTHGARTFSVKAYDTNNNYVIKSINTHVLASGDYYVHLQSGHKTVFYPGLNPECYANITMDYKIWFTFTESTRKVEYTDVEYLTQVSYQNSPDYPILGRMNPSLYDNYVTWVYDSLYGDVHITDDPAMVQVDGELGYQREFERDITSEGWYNTGKFYAGINYYCGMMLYSEQWVIICKIKCDGSPLYNLQASTYTPQVSGLARVDYLLYSYCNYYAA